MAVVTFNFNGVQGRTQVVDLAGAVTSVRVEFTGANPNTVGRLGFASFVLIPGNNTEFIGFPIWYQGRAAAFASGVTGLRMFWTQRRSGVIPLRLVYVNNL